MKHTIAWMALAFTATACAATSSSWEIGSYSDFLKGHLHGLSLSDGGGLRPGISVNSAAPLEQPLLWDIAAAPDGSIFAATGHRGRIFRIDRSGKSSLYASVNEPEIFALAIDQQGHVYAGSSPNGAIYRIDQGKAVELARLGTKYIWALQIAPDGTIYAATGDRGQIFRISPAGKAEVYFETGQANVTALALAHNGSLYAGSEPNGLLYEIKGPKQGSILFHSGLPEIHAVVVRPDGTLYASALGGSLASRVATSTASTSNTSSTVAASAPTVISISEQAGNAKPKDAQTSVTSTVTSVANSSSTIIDVSGVEKSAIYRIRPGQAVETLRSSKEENIYDLALDGDSLLFSTDVRGRVYRFTDDRKLELLTDTGDSEATRLVKTPAGLWVGLNNPAKVLLYTGSKAAQADYESPVHDTSTTTARWGRLNWQATGAGVSFRTRTGNSPRPDDTWSRWSDAITTSNNALITSPRGRYIEWRAEWAPGSTAQLQSVVIPFLPLNTPPVVRSITLNAIAARAPAATASASAYTVTVSDTGDSSSSSSGTNAQTLSRGANPQTQISWQADDPDGDKLVYAVYFRGEGESTWKLLKDNLTDNTFVIDSDVLADGKYYFRVVASDRLSNDLRYAASSDLVSTPVLVDNTPPTVKMSPAQRTGDVVEVSIDAQDEASPLRKCEYAVDGGPWQPVEADDGVTDSPQERFHIRVDHLTTGEHLLVVRVYDGAGNAGLAKVVIH